MQIDRRLVELNAIRGIAAMIVFVGHYLHNFMPPQRDAIGPTPLFAFANGPAAVVTFFVLSGFVLALGPLQQGAPSLLTHAVKRWPRLAGTVVISCVAYIVAALLHLFPQPQYVVSVIPHPPTILTWGFSRHAERVSPVLWEASFKTFFAGTAKHNDVLWTMHWELAGSFVVFALAAVVLLPLKSSLRIFLFAVVSAIMSYIAPYFGCFVVGAVAAILHLRFRDQIRLKGWHTVLALAFGVLILSWDIQRPAGVWAEMSSLTAPAMLKIWIALQTIASLAIIGAALYNRTFQNMLSGAAGSMLGRLSFPIYLMHLLVLCTFTSWTYLLLTPGGLDVATGTALFLATAAVTIVLAYPLALFDEWWVRYLNVKARHISASLQQAFLPEHVGAPLKIAPAE